MNLGGFKLVYATRNYANDLPLTMQHCRPSGNKSHVLLLSESLKLSFYPAINNQPIKL